MSPTAKPPSARKILALVFLTAALVTPSLKAQSLDKPRLWTGPLTGPSEKPEAWSYQAYDCEDGVRPDSVWLIGLAWGGTIGTISRKAGAEGRMEPLLMAREGDTVAVRVVTTYCRNVGFYGIVVEHSGVFAVLDNIRGGDHFVLEDESSIDLPHRSEFVEYRVEQWQKQLADRLTPLLASAGGVPPTRSRTLKLGPV